MENKNILKQFEDLLDEYMVKKAPFALPKEAKEFIVKVSPYLTIIFAILTLPIIFWALRISTFLSPLAAALGVNVWGFGTIVSLATAVITIILYLMAVQGLFNRTKSSWRLVFYASIVSLIGNILSTNGIIGTIIGVIIGWYILFQVKDMYKN